MKIGERLIGLGAGFFVAFMGIAAYGALRKEPAPEPKIPMQIVLWSIKGGALAEEWRYDQDVAPKTCMIMSEMFDTAGPLAVYTVRCGNTLGRAGLTDQKAKEFLK